MSEIIASKCPAESGHWYAKDGTPAYTIVGKNGKERNTTLRDARKEGLVPSVTSIIRMAAAPGLENWKADQVLMAALTLPRIEGEDEATWIARIKEDSKQQAIKAAERGTQIHAWIQQGFEGIVHPVGSEAEIYFHVAKEELEKHCPGIKWNCEQSFAHNGYGGKVDLNFQDPPLSAMSTLKVTECTNPEQFERIRQSIVIDIKTKDTPLDGIQTYDEHAMQLGAYRCGLNLFQARCGILFVSTKTIEAKLVWIDEEKLKRGEAMFMHLLNFYYAKTGLIA